jgi:CRISPR/Cas system CMR-associated protein Cmr3 (group 5 of RAMP superfamily)
MNPFHSKALNMFLEIREVLGDERARRVFAIWGTPPTASRLNEIKNRAIIDRLDLMIKMDKDGKSVRDKNGMLVFEPNVKELARQIAGEQYVNPTADEIAVVERQIRRLNAKRQKNPYWPQRKG